MTQTLASIAACLSLALKKKAKKQEEKKSGRVVSQVGVDTPTTIDERGLETTGAVKDVSLLLCVTIMPKPKLNHQFNNNKTVLCDYSKLYQLEIIFRYVIFEARLC